MIGWNPQATLKSAFVSFTMLAIACGGTETSGSRKPRIDGGTSGASGTDSDSGGAQGKAASPSTSTGGSSGTGAAGRGAASGGTSGSSGGRGATPAVGAADAGVDAGGSSPPRSGSHSERIEQIPIGSRCDSSLIQPAPKFDSLCPTPLCGNGQADSCQGAPLCTDHGGCFPTMASEECDTKTSQTCESMGFVQGQVSCSPSCRVDWSGCQVCGTDPRIEACARVDGLHYDQTGQTLALASNGERAAIVWPSLGRLRFALINDDLSLAPTDCFTDAGVNWSPYLAPIANGWMLAYAVSHADGSQSIQVTLLDASGAVKATPAPSINGRPTALIGRPDGGPLLLFSGPSNAPGDSPTTDYAMAALLDPSGQPLWTRRLTEAANAEDVAATYTGDGFLWASRPNGTDPLLARFELDGTMTTTTLALGVINFFTQLAWTGSEARLFWEQSYMSLDRTGHALGPVRTVLNETGANLPLPAQLGARTAVLLSAGRSAPRLGSFGGSGSSPGHRSLVVLDEKGVAQPPFVVFANGNQGSEFQRELVVVKDRLLAAFLGFDQRYHQDYALYLASIRP